MVTNDKMLQNNSMDFKTLKNDINPKQTFVLYVGVSTLTAKLNMSEHLIKF